MYFFAVFEKIEHKSKSKIQAYFPELESKKIIADSFEKALEMVAPLLFSTVQNLILQNRTLPAQLEFADFKKKYCNTEQSGIFIQAVTCPSIDQMPVKTSITISYINSYFLERERLVLGMSKSEIINTIISKERGKKYG